MKSWNQNCSHVSHKWRSLQLSFISMTAKESGIPGIAFCFEFCVWEWCLSGLIRTFGRKPQKLLNRLQKFQEQLSQSCLAGPWENASLKWCQISTNQKRLARSQLRITQLWWWNGGFVYYIYFINSGILWHYRLVRPSKSFKIDSTRKISNKDLQSSHLWSVSDASFRCDQLQTLCFLKFGSFGPWKGIPFDMKSKSRWGMWSI